MFKSVRVDRPLQMPARGSGDACSVARLDGRLHLSLSLSLGRTCKWERKWRKLPEAQHAKGPTREAQKEDVESQMSR